MKPRLFLPFLGILLLSVMNGGCSRFAAEEKIPVLKIHVLNVGQGLAVLFEQDGHSGLFDMGPDSCGLADSLYARGVRHLDWIIISHWHRDHAGGILDWNQAQTPPPEVDSLFYGPDTAGTWIRDSVLSLGKEEGIPVRPVGRAQEWLFGDLWTFRILWPPASQDYSGNNASLVLLIQDGALSALFPADLEQEGEAQLLEYAPLLHADFLQVGHHGSAQSTSLSFLSTLAPTQAVISVGRENSYGHPAQTTLRKLNLVIGDSSRIHRTDKEGSLTWTWAFRTGIWSE